MEEKNSIWKVALNYGAISGLGLVILSTIWYVTNLTFNEYVGILNYIIIIFSIIIATKKQREFDNGFINYGKALGVGSVIGIISGFILSLFTYTLYATIDPDLINKMFLVQEQALMTNPSITDEQIEATINLLKKVTTPSILAVGTFFSISFIGFVISLITSAVLKKNKEIF